MDEIVCGEMEKWGIATTIVGFEKMMDKGYLEIQEKGHTMQLSSPL